MLLHYSDHSYRFVAKCRSNTIDQSSVADRLHAHFDRVEWMTDDERDAAWKVTKNNAFRSINDLSVPASHPAMKSANIDY
jgi:hypothetical protein